MRRDVIASNDVCSNRLYREPDRHDWCFLCGWRYSGWEKRALLSDAFVISLLGTILGSICTLFIPLIGVILSFIVWLLLIRHYYETGWLGALAVAILAVIIYIVVLFILAFFLAIPLLLFRGLTSLLQAVVVQGTF